MAHFSFSYFSALPAPHNVNESEEEEGREGKGEGEIDTGGFISRSLVL